MPAVLHALEGKVQKLENEKLLIEERIASTATPTGDFDKRLRTALDFVSSPYDLWNTGRLEDRRAVPKLTFVDRLR